MGFPATGEDTEVGFGPAADFTWVKGKHVIKWGGELTRDWYNGNGFQEGAFDFSGAFQPQPGRPKQRGRRFR